MVHLKFTFEDAERIALTVHYKGRSVIKSGSVDELLPFKKILEEEGLSLTIED
jgi:ATP-dependent Clp protease adapter protein ClpS